MFLARQDGMKKSFYLMGPYKRVVVPAIALPLQPGGSLLLN